MIARRPVASAALACVLLTAAWRPEASAAAPADPGLPADVAAAFADRTPPVVAGEADALRDALDHVRAAPPAALAAAAEVHADTRKADLIASDPTWTTGRPFEFSPARDLLRFPEANRGRPVALQGTVAAAEPLAASDGTPLRLVRLTPADAPAATVALLLSDAAGTPEAGRRVAVVGLFLKLASLPNASPAAEGEADPVSAPLLVAAGLTVEPAVGPLPDPSLWKAVTHKSFGLSPAEQDVYYRLLASARDADPAALRSLAAEQQARRAAAVPEYARRDAFPTFVDVFKHPAAYEGRAVTLTGTARRIVKFPAGENAAGLTTLYEAWVFTRDSQTNPAVVVVSELPPGLPVGEDVQAPVRVTGWFFKIYGYKAQDTARIAPMILAGRLERLPEPEQVLPGPWLLLGAAALLAAVAGVVALLWSRRRPARRTLPASPDPPPVFDSERSA